MIDVRGLRFAYPNRREVLRDLYWHAGPGGVTLIAGDSGSGKSTLLRCLNGLIPHFHGGRFGGEVRIAGLSTRESAPRDLAAQVGTVFQDPESQVVTDTVVDEIVFTIEQLGYSRAEMRRQLHDVVEQLDIGHLLDRETRTLSGGERQLVVLAGALAVEPDVLVMDEPTSQLDEGNARRLLDTAGYLAGQRGMGVVIAEHRLSRMRSLVNDVLLLQDGGLRYLDLSMLEHDPWYGGLTLQNGREATATGDTLLQARDASAEFDGVRALARVDLEVREGEVLAITGPNGAGKTTLLRALAGIQRLSGGRVARCGPTAIRRAGVGYVPQNPTAILHQETLHDELAFTLRAAGRPGDIGAALELLGLGSHAERHPLDLSGGERQRAAVAAIAVSEPPVVLLDEPTRGLPAGEKRRLAEFVQGYASAGRAVVVATHDAEFVESCATREVVLASGKIVDERRVQPVTPVAPAAYAFDG